MAIYEQIKIAKKSIFLLLPRNARFYLTTNLKMAFANEGLDRVDCSLRTSQNFNCEPKNADIFFKTDSRKILK